MFHNKGSYCESNYKKQLENPQKCVVKLWKCGVCKAVYNSNEDMDLRNKNGRRCPELVATSMHQNNVNIGDMPVVWSLL